MKRIVEPEWLDSLPAPDARAVRSRHDLRRVNFFMGHAGIISGELSVVIPNRGPKTIADLGAGDGSLMLRLARRFHRAWPGVTVRLVDQRDLLSDATRTEFDALGWRVEAVVADVFDWLSQENEADVMLANLFLHHFESAQLSEMFRLAAMRSKAFVACEPRRSQTALHSCKLLWLIGCNSVTRHDAAISARAGFDGNELSQLWPNPANWELSERQAGLFSHCFTAVKLKSGSFVTNLSCTNG